MRVLIGPTIVLFFLIIGTGASANDPFPESDDWPEAETGHIELTSEQKEKAMAAVRASLKYPGSARFQNVHGVKDSSAQKGYRICGQVDARNGEYSYSGFKQFASSDGRTLVLKEINRGFIESRPALLRKVTLPSRPRAVVGSWWVRCRVVNRDHNSGSSLMVNN